MTPINRTRRWLLIDANNPSNYRDVLPDAALSRADSGSRDGKDDVRTSCVGDSEITLTPW